MLKNKTDLIERCLNIYKAPNTTHGIKAPAIILLLCPALISPKTYGVNEYEIEPNIDELIEIFRKRRKKKIPRPPIDR